MAWCERGRGDDASEFHDVRFVQNDHYQTKIMVAKADSSMHSVDPREDSRVGPNFDEESLGEYDHKRIWHTQKALLYAVISSIFLLIVVVLLAVGASKGFKIVPETINNNPNNITSSLERAERLHEYLSTVTADGAQGFNNPISPESRALAWMQNEDFLQLDPEDVENHYRIDQRFALLTLWFQSDYDWFRQRNWLTGTECMWEGVRCIVDPLNGNALVSELDMAENNLQGGVPTNLHLLKNLTSLDLSGNQIRGQVPETLGSMIELETMYLQNNFLSQEISLDFSGMTSLRDVNLANNQFDGTIPASLYNASSISRIQLDNNNFSGTISENIGGLPELCKFTNGVATVVNERYSNQTVSHRILPFWIVSFRSIDTFTAADNQLSGNISSISSIETLTALYLGNNDFTGEVNFKGNPNLQNLVLENNKFSGPLPDLSSSPNMQILRLGNNYFDNLFFPTNYLELSNMVNLGLNNLYLTGEIPATITALENLLVLNLEGNSLNGIIPESLTDLTNLNVLSLHDNELSGTIPADIALLTSLEKLTLSRNQLQSVVPAAIRRLTSLKSLTLASNRLSGPILNSVAFLQQLEVLDLSGNAFTGVIPDFFWNLRSLRALVLADNFFSGQIARSVGNLEQLQILNTASNSFRGTIPERITSLTNLKVLDLSFNFLGGPIPTNIGDLSDLRELRLGTNFDESNESFGLDGTIPASIGNMQKLQKLELNRNRISGFLPSQHKQLKSIKVYDVSENEKLGGTIPKDFSDMIELNGLNVFGTSIDGAVPNGFCSRNVSIRVDCGGATSISCSCCICNE